LKKIGVSSLELLVKVSLCVKIERGLFEKATGEVKSVTESGRIAGK
jgi:hypothetical protein